MDSITQKVDQLARETREKEASLRNAKRKRDEEIADSIRKLEVERDAASEKARKDRIALIAIAVAEFDEAARRERHLIRERHQRELKEHEETVAKKRAELVDLLTGQPGQNQQQMEGERRQEENPLPPPSSQAEVIDVDQLPFASERKLYRKPVAFENDVAAAVAESPAQRNGKDEEEEVSNSESYSEYPESDSDDPESDSDFEEESSGEEGDNGGVLPMDVREEVLFGPPSPLLQQKPSAPPQSQVEEKKESAAAAKKRRKEEKERRIAEYDRRYEERQAARAAKIDAKYAAEDAAMRKELEEYAARYDNDEEDVDDEEDEMSGSSESDIVICNDGDNDGGNSRPWMYDIEAMTVFLKECTEMTPLGAMNTNGWWKHKYGNVIEGIKGGLGNQSAKARAEFENLATQCLRLNNPPAIAVSRSSFKRVCCFCDMKRTCGTEICIGNAGSGRFLGNYTCESLARCTIEFFSIIKTASRMPRNHANSEAAVSQCDAAITNMMKAHANKRAAYEKKSKKSAAAAAEEEEEEEPYYDEVEKEDDEYLSLVLANKK